MKMLDKEMSMGLSVWFEEDVLRSLRAIRTAGQAARSEEQAVIGPDSVMAAYWRGFEAALASVGDAFGVRAGLASLTEAGDQAALIAPQPGLVIDYPLLEIGGKER
jgi:hypothetical protein